MLIPKHFLVRVVKSSNNGAITTRYNMPPEWLANATFKFLDSLKAANIRYITSGGRLVVGPNAEVELRRWEVEGELPYVRDVVGPST